MGEHQNGPSSSRHRSAWHPQPHKAWGEDGSPWGGPGLAWGCLLPVGRGWGPGPPTTPPGNARQETRHLPGPPAPSRRPAHLCSHPSQAEKAPQGAEPVPRVVKASKPVATDPPLPGACPQKSVQGGGRGLPTPGRGAELRPEQSPPPWAVASGPPHPLLPQSTPPPSAGALPSPSSRPGRSSAIVITHANSRAGRQREVRPAAGGPRGQTAASDVQCVPLTTVLM